MTPTGGADEILPAGVFAEDFRCVVVPVDGLRCATRPRCEVPSCIGDELQLPALMPLLLELLLEVRPNLGGVPTCSSLPSTDKVRIDLNSFCSTAIVSLAGWGEPRLALLMVLLRRRSAPKTEL